MPLTVRANLATQWQGFNGNVTAPMYSFSSAPGSGMFHAGNQHVGLSVNGSEVAQVTTQGLVVKAGSNVAPSITFAGNTSTGVYLSNTNTISLATAGTERVRVDQNGNVGIGTGTPKYTLDIGGFSATTNTLRLATASTGNSDIKLIEQYDADSFGFTIRNVGAGAARFDILRHSGDATGVAALSIGRDTGRVGIGTSAPGGELSLSTVNTQFNKKFILWEGNNTESLTTGTNFYGIGTDINNSTLRFNVNDTARLFSFYGGTTQFGYINNGTGFVNTFTGQHRSFPSGSLVLKPKAALVGLIVSATGDYVSVNQSEPTTGKNAIQPSEAVPMVNLTTTQKDPAVFGVISDKEDAGSRIDNYGAFKSTASSLEGDTRFIVNSLGEGGIWVCSSGGSLQNGDFICSSAVPGYGERQESGVLRNYTVAKITCDCEFSFEHIPKKILKKRTVTKTVTETVVVDKEEVTTTKQVVFDDILQKYVQKDVTETRHVKETLYDTVDLYDETGVTKIGEHQVERTVSKEVTEEQNDLDEFGNIQFVNSEEETETPYEMRYLAEDGTLLSRLEYDSKKEAGDLVYIAAFVGCTYHCG